jgi:hypothetical protein
MEIPPPPIAPAPAQSQAHVTPFPVITEAKQFPKWILRVRPRLHAKRWKGIVHQVADTPPFTDISYDLYVLLIICLDRDMLEPYIQGVPGSFSHQGISML